MPDCVQPIRKVFREFFPRIIIFWAFPIFFYLENVLSSELGYSGWISWTVVVPAFLGSTVLGLAPVRRDIATQGQILLIAGIPFLLVWLSLVQIGLWLGVDA